MRSGLKATSKATSARNRSESGGYGGFTARQGRWFGGSGEWFGDHLPLTALLYGSGQRQFGLFLMGRADGDADEREAEPPR